MHLGHGEQRQVDDAEQGAVVRHGPRFVAQIELLPQLQPEALEHLEQRAHQRITGLASDQLQQRLQQIEIDGDPPLDPWSQHLHCHITTVVRRGPVHHGDRSPPDGLGVEGLERIVERHAELVFDDGRHRGQRDHRPGVETGPELIGHVVAEHSRRRTDQLAVLQERRAELLERQAQRPNPEVFGQRLPTGPAVERRAEVLADRTRDAQGTSSPLGAGRLG